MATITPVQELALNGGTVPERYIRKPDDPQISDGPVPLVDVQTVDYSLLSSSPEEVEKLNSAFRSWGFTQLVNHGMTSSFLDEVREVGKQFFALPLEEKEKYSDHGAQLEGYGNHNTVEPGTYHWNDKLQLVVHPEQQIKLQYWPEKPENFRRILHEYSSKATMIHETLLKVLARSLNLDENRFTAVWQAGQDTIHARFNVYPRCPMPDRVIGLGAHADGTSITILLQDKEIEGLQVKKDNQWYRVPVIPGALVINVGDQLEITSNGIFKSVVHRVTVNPEHDRISLALLTIPHKEKDIGPLPELINEERPQLYKRVKDYGQYYYHHDGFERPIEVVKINNQ